MDYVSIVGVMAAVLTTAANLPQAVKCWKSGETHDISLKAFILLALGLATWVAYGFLIKDMMILGANAISTAIAISIIAAKLKNG